MSDILVVGAGPVGLTMACELWRHGVPCRVIDKAAEPVTQSRATDMQTRTLEILYDMGLVDRAHERGHVARAIQIRTEGRVIARIPLDTADSKYAYTLGISQAETEALLTERLTELGGTIERSTELVKLAQDERVVTATVNKAGGSWEAIEASYVVACDGASSTVRQALQLGFTGATYEEAFILADLKLDAGLAREDLHFFYCEEGFLLVLPMPGDGNVRLFANVNGDGETPTLESFTDIVHRRGVATATLSDPGWMARFRVHCRMIDRYRVGRVFLAGDAAHVHSPIGGQGMNLGMQDAYNLAWKLALVHRGAGKPILLDSYDLERRPIARAVLSETDRGTKAALLKNPIARALRDGVLETITKFPALVRRIVDNQTELSWRYRESPIVAQDRGSLFQANVSPKSKDERATVGEWMQFGAAPQPGDRAPDAALKDATVHDHLRGTKHVLFLFDGRAATEEGYARFRGIANRIADEWGDRVIVHAIVPRADAPKSLDGVSVLLDPMAKVHERYGAQSESMYLVRPDGYIAYRSQPADPDSFFAYLQRVL